MQIRPIAAHELEAFARTSTDEAHTLSILQYLHQLIETAFSLLTVVCQGKKMFHRTTAHLEARLAYTAAIFNVLLRLFWQLHPDQAFRLSIAEFSL
jgi:hypothetical protein